MLMSNDRQQPDIVQDEKNKTKTINTVEQSVLVEILPKTVRNFSWLIKYDSDNLYPNKVRTISQRSVSTQSAIETHSDFLAGQGFGEGLNEIEVNEEEVTLEEILKDATDNKSEFNAVALHFNYNLLGEIVEVNEICFEGLRWANDFSRLYYSDDWSKTSRKGQCIEYFPFDPENALNEINEVGIENYTGQVLYWIPRARDIYTPCRFHAAVNDSQFENESSIYKLRAIQNNFNLAGIFKLPPSLFADDEEVEDTTGQLKTKYKGAANANRSMFIPITNEEYVKAKLFEPIEQQNKDGFFQNQNKEAKDNIYQAYQMPGILVGRSESGMFNQDQFVDAFDYYNSKTQGERDQIEKVFNRFWPYTVWYNGEKLQIIPKEYIRKRDNEQVIEEETEDATNND